MVFTAHHDHLGRRQADAKGDEIYNGAVDNATGCAQLLALARAFMALPRPPAAHGPVPLRHRRGVRAARLGVLRRPPDVPAADRRRHQLRRPRTSRPDPRRDFVGHGKSSLTRVASAAARRRAAVVRRDPTPDKGLFYRRDQFNFARIGVPAIYFEAGTTSSARAPAGAKERQDVLRLDRYHQPCDEMGAGLGLGRHDRGHPARLRRGPRHRRRRRGCRRGIPATSSQRRARRRRRRRGR